MEEIAEKLFDVKEKLSSEEYRSMMDSLKKAHDDSSTTTRSPNAYNTFIKEEVTRIREKDPGISFRQAFQQAMNAWKIKKKKEKTRTRSLNAYNTFILEEVTRIREKDPGISFRQAFQQAMNAWKTRAFNQRT